MNASAPARWVSLVLLSALLASVTALAHAAGPPPVAGGTVPSTLELSLSEPSDFIRTGTTRGGNVYTSVIRAEVTSTDAPVQLSITEGEATTPLKLWREPASHATAKIRLRQVAPSAHALRGHHKLLLITLMAGGP